MITVGSRLGNLTVVNIMSHNPPYVPYIYEVKCDCGNPAKLYISSADFASGNYTSCGDCNSHWLNKKDVAGQTFGDLLALGRDLYMPPSRDVKYWCRCICGKLISIRRYTLTSGKVTSCGCSRIRNAEYINTTSELLGQQFGQLTVIEKIIRPNVKWPIWKCQCSCGEFVLATAYALTKGQSTCCYKCKQSSSVPDTDYIGKQFGRLTVLDVTKKKIKDRTKTFFKCQCSCDNKIVYVLKGNLLNQNNPTLSCGCIGIENTKNRSIKHGMHGTRLYGIYNQMRHRCYRKNDEKYPIYGGMGIKICDQWLESPLAFKEWAINNGYKDDLTIDRIDPLGHYCPENCRWVSNYEQRHNRKENSTTIGTVKYTTSTFTREETI